MGHHWQVSSNRYTFISKQLKELEQSLDKCYVDVLLESIGILLDSEESFVDVSEVNNHYKGCVGIHNDALPAGVTIILMAGFGKQEDKQLVVNMGVEWVWYKKIA